MKATNPVKRHDLLVIGGGPAGLTATAYAIRKRIETMLLTEDLGGKTNYSFSLPGVETHMVIDGQELVSKFKSQIEYLDFARHISKVTGFQKSPDGFEATTADGKTFIGRAAIIATGVSAKRLSVPGEEKFLGRGISYSTVSHAPIFIGMDVAVVGNGMPALQAAAELAQITKKVNIVAVPASLIDSPLGRSLKESGRVAFFSDYEVKEIEGQASPERMLLVSKTDKTETGIPVRGIFVELGYVPNTAMFTRLVKTTPEGRIIIDSRNQTNIPGLFAAGDVTDAYAQQVVVAIGEGANAALSAYDYLLSTKT